MTTEMNPAAGQAQFLGHPRGLFVCFATEMWERFSFYGMKYLLLLYLTKYHLFSDANGLEVLGSYAALVYAMPVIGGLLADRYLGMRKAVVFGGCLLVLGHLGMAIEGVPAHRAGGEIIRDQAALQVFYFSLALIVIGVGFLKPNISTIVGRLYTQDDPRRDAGFTIFYMGINLGAFTATLLCGYLGETLGWHYGFGAAGLGMLVGVMMGAWFLATAYSEFVAAQLAKLAAIDTADGTVADVGAALASYTELLSSLLWVGLGMGALLLLLSPLLKKMMHGVH